MKKELAAAFPSEDAARDAVAALTEAGIPRHLIEVRAGDLEDQVGPPVATVTGAHRVALICAIVAGGVSALLAVLMVSGVLPSRGFEFLGTSPLGAALRGAVAGAGAGALFGYILGMGMWEDDGEPATQIQVGDALVAIAEGAAGSDVDVEAARAVLERSGGQIL